MGNNDERVDRYENDVRAWLLEADAKLVDFPEQRESMPEMAWAYLLEGVPTGQRYAIFHPKGSDRIDLQTALELPRRHIEAYGRMRGSREKFLLELISVLLKHPVEHGLEDLPDLRRVRLVQHMYFDAWSKDLFWQRMMLIDHAARDAAMVISQRLGDPASILSLNFGAAS